MSEPVRTATCHCGRLSAEVRGDPIRISVCHCLACQQRSGSAFAAQARWPVEKVMLTGDATSFTRTGGSGGKATFRFCPICGETISFSNEDYPYNIAFPVGAFADPDFPTPQFSIYETRKYRWVAIVGNDVEHME
jgi:hypothetical protein